MNSLVTLDLCYNKMLQVTLSDVESDTLVCYAVWGCLILAFYWGVDKREVLPPYRGTLVQHFTGQVLNSSVYKNIFL
jgi:hypothetical protein